MIQLTIGPLRIERVVVATNSELEEDFDLARWVAIRPHVEQIEAALQQFTRPTQAVTGTQATTIPIERNRIWAKR